MRSSSVWQWFFPDEPFHMDEFRRTVRRHAGETESVLDLGCGDNSSFAGLRSTRRAVWGVDFQRHPHLVDPDYFRLLPPDGRLPFPDQSFGTVVALWVLEHVAEPRRFLAEIQRVLKPGGVFVGHSINGNHYVTWLRRAFDLLPHRATQWVVERLYGRRPHDTFPTCYRLNSRRQIGRAARSVGLEVGEMRHYADAGYFAFNRVLSAAASAADWLLEKALPTTGRIYFTVTMRRPADAQPERLPARRAA